MFVGFSQESDGKHFTPMVEVCTPNAALQLKLCGIEPLEVRCLSVAFHAFAWTFRPCSAHFHTLFGRKHPVFATREAIFCFVFYPFSRNTINTISMMSKAMCLVSIDTLAHGVLSDLLSAEGNNLDITYLRDYLGGQPLPTRRWLVVGVSRCDLALEVVESLEKAVEGHGEEHENSMKTGESR